MNVERIDPIHDLRWRRLVAAHSSSSVFHTPEWLEALHLTYGYEAVAFSASPASGSALANGVVFCMIRSWLTGRRMVSLPFSDHCEPLVEDGEDLQALLVEAKRDADEAGAQYVEVRPIRTGATVEPVWEGAQSYCLHRLDIRQGGDDLWASLHKSCVQRKIHRAERARLTCEEGNNAEMVERFHRLLTATRRRRGLLAQPLTWFRNLAKCLGDRLKIRLAYDAGRPLAGIVTLQFKDTVVYKYGCSDTRFNRLGGMQLLLWKAIKEGSQRGASVLDLGRSDWPDTGLIVFKDRWGAQRSTLNYWRAYSKRKLPQPGRRRHFGWKQSVVRAILPFLPERIFCATGSVIYRHIG